MEDLKRFSLPVKGFSIGVHHYQFDLGSEFFQHFGSTIIEEGNFLVDVELDKKTAVMNLLIKFEGKMNSICDRCLEPLELNIENENTVFIKYGEIESEDDDVIYITHSTSELNIAQIIYEYIVLSIPINRVYHSSDVDCKKSDLIKNEESNTIDEADERSQWNILKGLKFKE